MPVEGYTTITVSDEVKAELTKRAKDLDISVPKFIKKYALKLPDLFYQTSLGYLHTEETSAQIYASLIQGYDLKRRLDGLTRDFKGELLSLMIKLRAKRLRLEGEAHVAPSDAELRSIDSDASELASKFASYVVESDASVLEQAEAILKEKKAKSKASLCKAKILGDLEALRDRLAPFLLEQGGKMSFSDMINLADLFKRKEFWSDAIPYCDDSIKDLASRIDAILPKNVTLGLNIEKV